MTLRIRSLAVLAGALLAAPSGLSEPPPPPGATPAPVSIALVAAAGATASELAGAAAELPGRAQLELTRAASAALAHEAVAEPLARAQAWRERVRAWREAARTATAFATTLRGLSSAAGGPLGLADRVLDGAALLAVAALLARAALGRSAARG